MVFLIVAGLIFLIMVIDTLLLIREYKFKVLKFCNHRLHTALWLPRYFTAFFLLIAAITRFIILLTR